MNLQEFQNHVKTVLQSRGIAVSEVVIPLEDFDIIGSVYQTHPSISEKWGKEQIAEIYVIAGMDAIRGMHDTATKNAAFEDDITELSARIQELTEQKMQLLREKKDLCEPYKTIRTSFELMIEGGKDA